ncbi:MAG: leucine--tRNA ligase [Bacteroidia bacterium]|nr:leucine--tRNA ligase [Bacteroidia bacterium]
MEYNFKDIENKWQKIWKDTKPFKADNTSTKPKYYVLDMFPYPSGAGLHVGHPLGYIASDIMARYKRHKGFNVLHPMGYDSFGLPAEQYAIQTGQHPAVTTEQNIARYREQLDKIGFSFDWDREVRTSDPSYYKWTQWIFIQLFNSWYNPRNNKAEPIESLIKIFETEGFKGLTHDILTGDIEKELEAFTPEQWKNFDEKKRSDVLMNFRLTYLGEAYVNWCPALGTVLANDEVKDGVSERGGHPVERKLMKQWSMRITAYAQRLLDGLDTIDWTESLKESQRYWIGRSEGTSLKFQIENSDLHLEVFTTRPDTIFGVSFITIAPEHEYVDTITTAEQKAAVLDYVTKAKNRSERERQADVTKVSGVFTGAYVIHPFTGKKVQIWVGDYVLAGYGTGAVMAVPGHDERDHRFAKHFGLPILQVVEGPDVQEQSYDAKEGKCINSDFLNGLEVKAAIKKAIEEIEKRNLGKGKTNYRLRDAVFGRQRYWGEPIPVYYKDGIPHVMPENELPLVLPEVDKFLPTEDGEPPLARAKDWKYKGQYDYEWTTMPGWAGSSWYFLRYMDAKNDKAFADKKLTDYWQNVDLYIGGSEHATGHLLYVRFWTKFLFDRGFIAVDEPAKKLINQGMIQGMSEKINRLISVEKNPDDNNKRLIYIYKGSVLEEHNIPLAIKNVFISSDIIDKSSKFDYSTDKYANVNNVSNSVLDIKKHLEWWNEDSAAAFICEGGYWLNNEFISFNNNGSNIFKTTPEVEKMSKSKHNVQTPDDICEKFGADTLRLYEMFLGPLEQSKPWNTNGITGVSGFLKKLWRLFYQTGSFVVSEDAPTKPELKTLHKTIKKITEDIERFSFNTSVSNFMICVNELSDLKCNKRAILEPLLVLISPYAPHVAEELWEKLGHKGSIAFAAFPEFNEAHLVEDNFNYPISFNGKMRFNLELAANLSVQEIEKLVMEAEQTHKYLEGKQPKKVIIVPKKIVNIVM